MKYVSWRLCNFRSDDFNLTTMNLGSVASSISATLYQETTDGNGKLWNTVSTEIYIYITPYTVATGVLLYQFNDVNFHYSQFTLFLAL